MKYRKLEYDFQAKLSFLTKTNCSEISGGTKTSMHVKWVPNVLCIINSKIYVCTYIIFNLFT